MITSGLSARLKPEPDALARVGAVQRGERGHEHARQPLAATRPARSRSRSRSSTARSRRRSSSGRGRGTPSAPRRSATSRRSSVVQPGEAQRRAAQLGRRGRPAPADRSCARRASTHRPDEVGRGDGRLDREDPGDPAARGENRDRHRHRHALRVTSPINAAPRKCWTPSSTALATLCSTPKSHERPREHPGRLRESPRAPPRRPSPAADQRAASVCSADRPGDQPARLARCSGAPAPPRPSASASARSRSSATVRSERRDERDEALAPEVRRPEEPRRRDRHGHRCTAAGSTWLMRGPRSATHDARACRLCRRVSLRRHRGHDGLQRMPRRRPMSVPGRAPGGIDAGLRSAEVGHNFARPATASIPRCTPPASRRGSSRPRRTSTCPPTASGSRTSPRVRPATRRSSAARSSAPARARSRRWCAERPAAPRRDPRPDRLSHRVRPRQGDDGPAGRARSAAARSGSSRTRAASTPTTSPRTSRACTPRRARTRSLSRSSPSPRAPTAAARSLWFGGPEDGSRPGPQ